MYNLYMSFGFIVLNLPQLNVLMVANIKRQSEILLITYKTQIATENLPGCCYSWSCSRHFHKVTERCM